MKTYHYRPATAADQEHLPTLFSESVEKICCNDYNARQISEWLAKANKQRWAELFASDLQFYVAVDENNDYCGFTSVNTEGYIHSMFVHPSFARTGVATLLLEAVAVYASKQGIKKLWSEVSLTARPFFTKQGFHTDHEQTVVLNGVKLTNFLMSKQLA